MDRLINILGAQTRSAEAEVAERSAFMFRTTVGILVGGTIAALVIAFLLTGHLSPGRCGAWRAR